MTLVGGELLPSGVGERVALKAYHKNECGVQILGGMWDPILPHGPTSGPLKMDNVIVQTQVDGRST